MLKNYLARRRAAVPSQPLPASVVPWLMPTQAAEPTRMPFVELQNSLSPIAPHPVLEAFRTGLQADPRLRARLQEPLAQDTYSDMAYLHTAMPRGTPVVVFDVDGTLTTGNAQLLRQLLFPKYLAKVRPCAVEMTWAWSARGYGCVYITGRPTFLAPMTQRWFSRMGFAPGLIQFTERRRDMLPSHGFTGKFKESTMRRLHNQGLAIRYAYGNVATDVRAYQRIGVDLNHIITTGSHPGQASTVAAAKGFTQHLPFVMAAP